MKKEKVVKKVRLRDPVGANLEHLGNLVLTRFKGCIPIQVYTPKPAFRRKVCIVFWLRDNEYIGILDDLGYCMTYHIDTLIRSNALIDADIISKARVGDIRPIRIPIYKRRGRLQ